MFLKKQLHWMGGLGMAFALLNPILTPVNTYASTTRTHTGDTLVNGSVQSLVADVIIPSFSPDLIIDPNAPGGGLSPEFEVENQGTSPMRLSLRVFEQTTSTFNDVLPDKYPTWEGLNKEQSKDIALGLEAKSGSGWQQLTTPLSYVANHSDHQIGVIKPKSTVQFSFDVHTGKAFDEAKTVQYRMVFVFDLLTY